MMEYKYLVAYIIYYISDNVINLKLETFMYCQKYINKFIKIKLFFYNSCNIIIRTVV